MAVQSTRRTMGIVDCEVLLKFQSDECFKHLRIEKI